MRSFPKHNDGRKARIGIMVGNYHTDHPSRLIHRFWELMHNDDVELRFYLGTEGSSFLTGIVSGESNYDYQYAHLYGYSAFDDLDVLIVSIGTLSIYHTSITVHEFTSKLPNVPVILLEDDDEVPGSICVISDNYGGESECVEHLINEHGLSKIAFIAGPVGNCDSDERMQAYIDVMEKHGFTVTESMIEHGDYSEYVDNKIEALLDNNPGLEAIVSANDEMAVAVYRVCKARGLTIGKDIAVTGFDDTEMAKYMDPPLTTTKQDYEFFAEVATRKAYEILEGKKPKSERLPTCFVRRSSCSCSDHPESEESEINEERSELINNMWESVDYQRQSWVGTLLMRELLLGSQDMQSFFEQLGMCLSHLKVSRSYVYLLEDPNVIKAGEKVVLPKDAYLAMVQNGEKCKAYVKKKNIMLDRRRGSGIPDKIPEGRYISYLLYYGEYQYGTFSVDIEPDRIKFFYLIALEIGSALRYLQIYAEQRRYQAELQMISQTDNLTGLYNRFGLIDSVPDYIKNHRKNKLVALMADMDHLKQINDTFGHGEGDIAIKKAGEILRNAVGNSPPLGRTGGDEYMCIFCAATEEEAMRKMEKIKEGCNRYNERSGKPYYVEISFGYYIFEEPEFKDISSVMKYADNKLYEQKKLRRESVLKEQTG